MRAIIHIGRPKVGSTTLQEFLWENRQELGRRGVLYHRLDPGQSSQFELPIAALTDCDRRIADPHISKLLRIETLDDQRAYATTMMRRFEEDLRTHGDGKELYIASTEHAVPYLRNNRQTAAFDTILRRYFDDVTYVIYIRDQLPLYLSSYSEMIKRGRTSAFQPWLDRAMETGELDHLRVLRAWINGVGQDALRVRLLERDALVGGDLIEDFCHSCGISAEGLVRPAPQNLSLSRDATEVLRVLNGLVPSLLPDGRPNPLRRDLVEYLLEQFADAPPLAFTRAQAQAVQDCHATGNEKVRALFWPGRPALFQPRALPESDIDARIDSETALEMALSMLIAVRQGRIAPLNGFDLRHAISTDPPTATDSGAAPTRAPFIDRWPKLKSPRLRPRNFLNRG